MWRRVVWQAKVSFGTSIYLLHYTPSYPRTLRSYVPPNSLCLLFSTPQKEIFLVSCISLVQGCNYVGADRLQQTRRDITRQFKQTREKLSESQSKQTKIVNTNKLQAAPVTVHKIVSKIQQSIKVPPFYVLHMANSFTKCVMQLCPPWRWPVRVETCISLCTLKHYCDFNQLCTFVALYCKEARIGNFNERRFVSEFLPFIFTSFYHKHKLF